MKTAINLAVLAMIFAGTQSAYADDCEKKVIEHVSANGDIIETTDGTEYETGDSPSDWHTGDAVLVCDDETMIHLSDGEKIDVSER